MEFNLPIWTDTPETPITAEQLNLLTSAIQSLLDNRSQVGDIVCNSNLDTMEKVIERFGGTKWERIEGRFLLGVSNLYSIGTTGGEASVTLKINEMPGHIHNTQGYVTLPPSTAGADNTRQAISRTRIGSDPVDTNTSILSTGGGQAHNNMPPYKAVYMWERVE